MKPERRHGGTTVDTQFPPPTAAPDDAAEGGDLSVLAVGDVDYIDPGAAYYQFSYMVTSATQRQLLSWAPDDLTEPTPDIATDAPTISDDGKTITYDLQSGIKFSPPVDREVVCDDFKYSIERALLPGVANGYVGLYFTDIVGFADAQEAAEQTPTKAPDMSGDHLSGRPDARDQADRHERARGDRRPRTPDRFADSA